MPDYLFDFQKHLVDWSLRKGRSAIFADCGLGKTPMQLVWAENIVRKENKALVLIVDPTRRAHQNGRKRVRNFSIEDENGPRMEKEPKGKITVTNYERLHLFNSE